MEEVIFSENIRALNISLLKESNLSLRIKAFLDQQHQVIIDKLDNGEEVTFKEFDSLIKKYFETLDFCSSDYDVDILNGSISDITSLFTYLDSLDLDGELSSIFIYHFFEKTSYYQRDESSAIYDLLVCDEIRNSKMMKEFLDCDVSRENSFVNFTKRLYILYDNLSQEQRDKLKYIFHSSLQLLEYFIRYYEDLNVFFNSKILDFFSKESLGYIFRNKSFKEYIEFFESDDYFLEIIGSMCNYILEKTGHCTEFMSKVFDNTNALSNKNILYKLFREYYENYYKESLIRGFDDDVIFHNLMGIVVDYGLIKHHVAYKIDTLEKMFKDKIKDYDQLYIDSFSKKMLINMKHKTFNPRKDLKNYDIYFLKSLVFKRVFGINYDQAEFISEKYGSFVDVCEDDFFGEDKKIVEIIKAINNVYLIDDECPNRDEKITSLVNGFYEYVKENGLYPDKESIDYLLLRAMIDRIYMKTFKKDLYKVDKKKVLYYHDGVSVIDAGVDFKMLVTVCGGVGESYYCDDNYRKQYNSSRKANNQGICCSYINNENFGLISLSQPIVAFDNLSDDCLNAMGVGDIYSETTFLSLKDINSAVGEGRYFLSADKLIDYTRFGYNELVIDRFLMDDKDNILKVQPSYVVAFKIDKNYKYSRHYERGLKMAKEFNIPLVLIDVEKVKENERNEIHKLEDELFSSNQVNYELMEKIITRYMNNYNGSMTMVRSGHRIGNGWLYDEDFSIRGLVQFLNKFEKKAEDLLEEELEEWYDALKDCYELEKEKNNIANSISSFSFSIDGSEFVLDDEVSFMSRVDKIYEDSISRNKIKTGILDIKKVCSFPKNVIPEIEVVVDLANELCEYSFVKIRKGNNIDIYRYDNSLDQSSDVINDYGMIISYFLGDYKCNYYRDLECCDLSKIKFNQTNESLIYSLRDSEEYSDKIRRSGESIDLIYGIYRMRDDDFLKIFNPIIEKYDSNGKLEYYLLDKKNNIREQFFEIKICNKRKSAKEKVIREMLDM